MATARPALVPVGLPAGEDRARLEAIETRGLTYHATVTPSGLRFEAGGISLGLRASRIEQGGVSVPCDSAAAPRIAADGVARLDRGCLVEEYVFEHRRVEQLFRIAAPLALGALRIVVATDTDLEPRRWSGAPQGGLAFGRGDHEISYSGAVAIDADGRRRTFLPRFEGRDIVLEVPASFLKDARFPLVVDPWIELGGSASGGGVSNNSGNSDDYRCQVVIDADGRPIVAWSDNTLGNHEIFVLRWEDGNGWVPLAGSGPGGNISKTGTHSQNPSLALDSSRLLPVVAWHEFVTGAPKIHLRRWTGAVWEEVGNSASGGGISPNTGYSQGPSVAVDSIDNLYVAWSAFGVGNEEIYLSKWDGFAWIELGGSASGGGISSNPGGSGGPSLAVHDEKPVVAWTDSTPGIAEIYVRRWEGGVWADLAGSAYGGGLSQTPGGSFRPSLVVDGFGNPRVAWEDQGGLLFKAWTGFGWIAYGNSNTAAGLGAAPHPYSQFATLQLGPDGNPIIAWHEYVAGLIDIRLRRWDGASWVEVDGSATGGGISNTPETSFSPSLAVGPSGQVAVAWVEFLPLDTEIYLRTNSVAPPAPVLVSITVSPASATVAIGGAQPFQAEGLYSDGTVQVLQDASWSSSDGGVASLDTAGLALGLTPGTVEITATFDGVTGAATLTVQPNTPQQNIQGIATNVQGLVGAGVLNGGNGNALTSKLSFAIASIDAGALQEAIGALNAFINQVRAFVRTGKLDAATGQALISQAAEVIGQLTP